MRERKGQSLEAADRQGPETPSFTLRPATEGDFSFIHALRGAGLREYVDQIWGWDEAVQAARFREHFDPARYQVVVVDGVKVRLLLAKNPAGWAETLDLIRPAPLPVVVGINARIADGRDPSWLWDVPFERLQGRLVIATGDRGRDLAVRLRYAEVEHRFVAGYRDAVRAAGAPDIDLAANYTSFQDARGALALASGNGGRG